MSYRDYGSGRDELLGGSSGGYGDEDASRGFDSRGMMSQQEQIMREQDQGLDMLSQSLRRQMQLGLDINDELTTQNEMLEDLDDGMDNTHRRLVRETQHVVTVTEKAKSGCMFCTIVLLILAIIIIAAV
eukprot:m.57516 g.57516  ORF g.57516 m.57516 type:complete len:129 (+) comp7086_c0_seq2:1135-1521(+)